jgi:hypothetical protein
MGSSGRLLTSAAITDDSIMNADVNSAAGIGLAKLAHVGANQILRSNGTNNVAGQIVGTDIAANALDATQHARIVQTGAMHPNRLASGAVDYAEFQRIVATGAIHANRMQPGTFDVTQVNAAFGNQSINGSHLVDGTVDYTDLAQNSAVNFNTAYPSSSGPSTTSTTPVQMPEMSLVLTTLGRPVVVMFNGTFYNTTPGNLVSVHAFVNGVDAGMGRWLSSPGASYYATLTFFYVFAPGAGTHTLQMYWSTSGGTLVAYSSWRMMIAMEMRR